MSASPLAERLPDPFTGLGCIVDCETTGLAATDEAIEVGLVLFAYNRTDGAILGVIDEYTGLREPTVPINPGAYGVHGISAEAVRGQRFDFDRIEQIFMQAEFIIAHNAPFDRRFIAPLAPKAGEMRWLCSMSGINWYKKGFRSKGLQALLTAHGIASRDAHRALGDVYAVLSLLSHEHDGPPYLAELLDIPPAI